jgi:two-component system sensor histidine kinase CpxA
VHVTLASREFLHPPDGIIVASSERPSGNRVFVDWRPWFWATLAVLLVSALIWLPFVHRVTRRLRHLTDAAESISEGEFDVEVASARGDELGRLSRAVQRMARRLDEYVAGQSRFIGDIAHELCSPLVRVRMSVGILEQQLPESEHGKLAALSGEVEELSQLVNELLDFSKASINPGMLPKEDVNLPEFLTQMARREGPEVDIQVESGPPLVLHTNRDLLRRALGNVVRNAVRYAGADGPIRLTAGRGTDGTRITVRDRGPGVPEEWLEKIFEPFARPERARTREGGGAGLGLAIARTCTESLNGTIRGWNRADGGFAVELHFQES